MVKVPWVITLFRGIVVTDVEALWWNWLEDLLDLSRIYPLIDAIEEDSLVLMKQELLRGLREIVENKAIPDVQVIYEEEPVDVTHKHFVQELGWRTFGTAMRTSEVLI